MALSPHNNQYYVDAEKLLENIFEEKLKEAKEQGSEDYKNMHERHDDGQLKNAFMHAGVSAYFAYYYSGDVVRALGIAKERFTLEKEVEAHNHTKDEEGRKRGEDIAYKDGARDLFNNDVGIDSAVWGKGQGETFEQVANDIFKKLLSNKLIVDFRNDPRIKEHGDNYEDYKNRLDKEFSKIDKKTFLKLSKIYLTGGIKHFFVSMFSEEFWIENQEKIEKHLKEKFKEATKEIRQNIEKINNKINVDPFSDFVKNMQDGYNFINYMQSKVLISPNSFNFTDNSKEINELINYKPEVTSFNENISEGYSVKKESRNEVVETRVVEDIEDKIYPYCLKVSPNEILKFKTKEEWVDKIG